jgi:tetratricopeptide (TPR) repeat protein
MTTSSQIEIIGVIAAVFLIIWFASSRFKRSSDPAELALRWTLTIGAITFWVYLGIKTKQADPLTTFFYVAMAMVSALLIAWIWAPRIGDIMASPFTRLYDGGDEEPELRPMYSIAVGYRKRGQYDKAILEIRKQLANFPEDFEGWLLLAEIQFKNLNDLPAASETIEHILTFPELAPKNVAFALTQLAEWHLHFGNGESARATFERIIERLPDTEQSHVAIQRIAHIASPEHMAEMHEPRVIVVPHSDERVGLRTTPPPAPVAQTPSQIAQKHIDHLRDHPLDNEAREKLAVLYATDFNRLDLATAELEQLIATPNQTPKNVAHWLNQLADFQIRLTNNADLARQTLQRIIDLYPKSAVAANAAVRISQLKLELNQNTTQRTLKLGSYEQNIGLKRMSSAGANEETP